GANGFAVGESSCCAKPADRAVKKPCCASGEVPDAESVCHCPPHPVESVPSGVVLETVAFTGPFMWWAELQAHANEVQLLAPHLGGLDAEYVGVWSLDLTLGNGLLKPNRGPTGPAAAKLCRGGLIAFLADLSVANL
ncbi:MAG: hypothetical protein P1V35_06105, partial [Planctomycetota bacterium]|nr:hypothetical protein [Planctomycetota bacterium]